MSFDPQGYHPEPTQRPPQHLPDATPAVDPDLIESRARDKIMLPAIFLIGMAILNVVLALGMGGFGMATTIIPADQFEKDMKQKQPEQWKQFEDAGYTAEDVIRIYRRVFYGTAGVWVVGALLCVVGGIRMLALRNFGLSMLSALVMAVPCVSPMACPCFFLGTIIGAWCVIVMLNPEVREAFR